jgi:hypothetical protein
MSQAYLLLSNFNHGRIVVREQKATNALVEILDRVSLLNCAIVLAVRTKETTVSEDLQKSGVEPYILTT